LKIRISFEVFTEYMKVNLSGDSLYAEIKDVLMNIRKLAEENNHTRIIIDAVNTKVLSEMEKFPSVKSALIYSEINLRLR